MRVSSWEPICDLIYTISLQFHHPINTQISSKITSLRKKKPGYSHPIHSINERTRTEIEIENTTHRSTTLPSEQPTPTHSQGFSPPPPSPPHPDNAPYGSNSTLSLNLISAIPEKPIITTINTKTNLKNPQKKPQKLANLHRWDQRTVPTEDTTTRWRTARSPSSKRKRKSSGGEDELEKQGEKRRIQSGDHGHYCKAFIQRVGCLTAANGVWGPVDLRNGRVLLYIHNYACGPLMKFHIISVFLSQNSRGYTYLFLLFFLLFFFRNYF